MALLDYATVVIGLGIAGVGVFLVLVGVQYYLKGRQVVGEEILPVEDLEPGPVSVSGIARPAEDGVLEAPFSDRDCLALAYEVREVQGKNKQTPTLIAEGAECVPFYVDDGTGELLVDPETADIELQKEEKITVHREEPPPEPIERFLAQREDIGQPSEATIDVPGSGRGTRYFREQLLETGEDVSVYGRASQRQHSEFGETHLELREGATGGILTPPTTFVVADRPIDAVSSGQRSGGLVYLALGVVAITIGRAVVLATPLV